MHKVKEKRMDASDDDGVRFEDAHDFFSFEGDRRDPFELSFSGTLNNLQSFVEPTTDYLEDEENSEYSNDPLKELVDTMVVPNIKLLIQCGKDGHASLINTTVDFLGHAEKDRLTPSDHQAAVIENSKHLQKQCHHLATHKQSILGNLGPIDAKIAAVVESLQSVETDLEKQISESELQAKLMREAIADIDEFVAHLELEKGTKVSNRKHEHRRIRRNK